MGQKIVEIKDFDGYFISNYGKVFCNLGRGNRDKTKRVDLYEIKGRTTKNGYLRVYMRNTNGKRVDRYIHRLVATHFIPNIDNKKEVNHLDLNRANNRFDNLEWVTHGENMAYAINQGGLTRDSKGKFIKRA